MATATEEKLDLYRRHKAEYAAPKKPVTLRIGKGHYLAVTGRGAPGSEEFQDKIGALYAMAFTIKMTRKFAGRGDYTICKLEGQYWSDEKCTDPLEVIPKTLNWRLLIRTPDFITRADLAAAVAKLIEKQEAVEVNNVKLVTLSEGTCVQMLHIGAYDEEERTVREMLAYTESEGLEVAGHHHEIYLSDPRRVKPERLRTILRLPVKKRGL